MLLPSDAVVEQIRQGFRATYLSHTPIEWFDSDEGQREILHEIVHRYNNCVNFTLPWLLGVIERPVRVLLEVGCGTGAKTAALATIAEQVSACDISEPHLLAAAKRLVAMGIDNAHVEVADASAFLTRAEHLFPQGVDVVVFYALLEHMTIAERLDALTRAWRCLRPGGVMVVQETPNRVLPMDHHSSGLPFFHQLPDELALRYAARARYDTYRNRLQASKDPLLTLYRSGRQASFHEFELALGVGPGELEDIIVADGWNVTMLNLESAQEEEVWMREWARRHDIWLPPAFSRYWIDLIAKKGGRSEVRMPVMPAVLSTSGPVTVDAPTFSAVLDPGGKITFAPVDSPIVTECVLGIGKGSGLVEVLNGEQRVALITPEQYAAVPTTEDNQSVYFALPWSRRRITVHAVDRSVVLSYLHMR